MTNLTNVNMPSLGSKSVHKTRQDFARARYDPDDSVVEF